MEERGMRIKLLYVLLVVLMVSCLIFGACAKPTTPTTPTAPSTTPTSPSAPSTQVIELNLATHLGAATPIVKLFEEFSAEMSNRTNGSVKITIFPGATLCDPANTADAVKQGAVDIGLFMHGYNPGRFPVSEAFSITFPRSAWIGAFTSLDFYNQFKPKELDDYHMANILCNGQSLLYSKYPITKLEDIKGKKIRCGGLGAEKIKLFGAVPTFMPLGDAYDSLNKGIMDIMLAPYDSVSMLKMYEVTKYITDVGPILGQAQWFLVMQRAKYESFPPEIQKTLDEVTAEYQDKYARAWNDWDFIGKDLGKEKGMNISALSPAEKERWSKTIDPIKQTFYVEPTLKLGFSQQEIDSWFDYMAERDEYWFQEQIKRGIKSATGPAEILQ